MKPIDRDAIAWKLMQIQWMGHENIPLMKVLNSFYNKRLKGDLYTRFMYRGKREAESLGIIFSERMPPGSFHEMFYDEEYYNEDIHRMLSDSTRPIIFDIGAWYGDSILYFARKYNAEVFAFEPLREPYSVAEENIKLNNLTERVHLENIAISDGFQIEGSTFGAMLSSSGSVKKTMKTMSFKSRKLDDYIFRVEHCELLKIDVEGFELNVLNGAREFIEKFKPCVIIEVHSKQIKNSVLRILSTGRRLVEGRKLRLRGQDMTVQNLFFIPLANRPLIPNFL